MFEQIAALCLNVALALAVGSIVLLFFYKSKKFDYWSKQGLKGPRPVPIFGNSYEQFIKPANLIELDRYEKYGKVYGYFDLKVPVLSIADPELIKLIFVKDSNLFINRHESRRVDSVNLKSLLALRDENWKRVRSTVSPAFTSGKIKRMLKTIEECSSSLLRILNTKAERNEEVDMKSLFGSFAMNVIARCAFGTETDTYKNPNDPFVTNAIEWLHLKFSRVLLTMFCPKFFRKLFNIDPTPQRVVFFFVQLTKHLINQRKESKIKTNDFLQLLIDAEQSSTDLENEIKDINDGLIGNSESREEIERNARLLNEAKHSGKKLSEEEIIAQVMVFLVAGYETTASLLSFTSYCLAINESVQEKLYDEIKTNVDKINEINYELLNSLPYLNAVINEALRIYPPVMRTDRQASQDYKIPINDIVIPKGGLVSIPILAIHHDPNNFSEPEKFIPERFLASNIENIKPYTYLPFGSGPRNCIGMRFALAETKLALCKLLYNFKLKPCENTDIPLKVRFSAALVYPVKRIILKVEKRR
ncbi:Cytochrome P450 3A13-like protein [Dinothrombium tinctorium]|uniref:Cytochrome P450 3A13-like protein n=1 Tax=Dinothrombium tinctorium TaxID=1965070 RepID=A0A443QXT5_9ACAR|nr:Cytochrome P450 3A13-like protein [Dinothrombium tinctorium]